MARPDKAGHYSTSYLGGYDLFRYIHLEVASCFLLNFLLPSFKFHKAFLLVYFFEVISKDFRVWAYNIVYKTK